VSGSSSLEGGFGWTWQSDRCRANGTAAAEFAEDDHLDPRKARHGNVDFVNHCGNIIVIREHMHLYAGN